LETPRIDDIQVPLSQEGVGYQAGQVPEEMLPLILDHAALTNPLMQNIIYENENVYSNI
jgi:hypothetical protein